MCKTIVLLIALLAFPMVSSAQVIDGYVTDEYGKPVGNAFVITKVGDTLTTTDALGYFDFEYQKRMTFGIRKTGYSMQWFSPKGGTPQPMSIMLGIKSLDLAEVVITRRGMENALDIESVNILDYRPFNSYILTLKKKKRSYYLGVDSVGAEGINLELSMNRPERLFIDCMNNTYVISEDSAYQVHVGNGTIAYISTLPLRTFNKYIASCVSDFGNGLVLQEFTGFRQKYELTLYEDGVAKPFFSKMDSVGYEMAYEDMHRIRLQELAQSGDSLAIKEYLNRETMSRNVSQSRQASLPYPHYDGPNTYAQYSTLPPGQIDDQHLHNERRRAYNLAQRQGDRLYGTSRRQTASATSAQLEALMMLHSQALNIRTFQVGNFMLVVDYDLDSVKIYNNLGEFQQSAHFSIGDEVEEVWKDRSTGILYLYCTDRGTHKLHSLNPITGETIYVKSFKKAPRTESVQVFGGWVYFRVIENGYFGIKRVKLPDSSYHES